MANNNLNYKVGMATTQAKAGANQLKNSLTSLGRSTKTTSSEMGKLYGQIRKTNTQFSNMTKDANRANQSLGMLTKGMKSLNMAFGTGQLLFFGRMLGKAWVAASDMVEVTNLFYVSLGKASDEGNKFIETMSTAFGLDQTNLKSAVGTFALLARSMGINNDNSAILSTNMAKLALDLSSLNNIPINQVMQDLRSGLVGQSETVYKYGIDVTEASLKTEAMNQGITKSVRNMSQGEKMALRYSVMLRQTGLAQGDFARTLETPANQMRILGERIVSLTRSIGSLFIPVLAMTLPYMNAFVALLTKAISSLAALFGFEMPEIDYSSLGQISGGAEDVADGFDKASKAAKKLTSGMDELNVLDPSSGSSGAEGVTAGDPNAFKFAEYDNLMNSVKMKADELEAKMKQTFLNIGSALRPILDALTPLADMTWDGLKFLVDEVLIPVAEWAAKDVAPVFIDLVSNALRILKEVLDELKPVLGWLWDTVLKPLGEFAGDVFLGFLETLNSGFSSLADFLEENDGVITNVTKGLGGLALAIGAFELLSFIGQVGSLTGAFKALLGTSGLLTASLWSQVAAWGALWLAKIKDFAQTVTLKAMYLADFLRSIVTGTAALASQIVQFGLLTAAKIADAIKTVALTVATNAMKVAQLALNVVMNANPIMLVVTLIAGLVAAFITAYKTSETFRDTVNGVFESIKNTITNVISTINGIIGGFISKVSEAINAFKEFLGLDGQAPTVSAPTVSGKTKTSTPTRTIPKLASGGLLEGGQLFTAGEFGKAEMIGSYNGKTTVMPLEDSGFIQAMYSAVYSAVSASMQSGGQVIETVVQLDGDVIYKNQQKVAQSRGKEFNLGVFSR